MARRRNARRQPAGRPQVVSAPVARAAAPGRASRYPPVPFTGTERLLSLAPTPLDGASFIRSYEWNPGLSRTFSVGHFQAQNFDKYEMGARNSISYTPACSTLTPGSTYILIDYDPNDPAPTTEDEFADNELTKTCALYASMSAPIDPSQLDQCKMLIRGGPSKTDKLLTDPCAIHIGAFGYGTDVATNGLTLGHYHINYSAKLLVRQPLGSAVPLPRNMAAFEPDGGVLTQSETTLLQNETTVNTLDAENDFGAIRLPPGWYNVHSRAGFSVPASGGLAPSGTFISLEVRRNGTRVDRSQSVINRRFAATESVVLSSTIPILVEEGDILTQVVVHDSDSTPTILADRSLLTFHLI